MGSKVLLVLVMFMATILLISAAPNEYQNFDKKDGNFVHIFSTLIIGFIGCTSCI